MAINDYIFKLVIFHIIRGYRLYSPFEKLSQCLYKLVTYVLFICEVEDFTHHIDINTCVN